MVYTICDFMHKLLYFYLFCSLQFRSFTTYNYLLFYVSYHTLKCTLFFFRISVPLFIPPYIFSLLFSFYPMIEMLQLLICFHFLLLKPAILEDQPTQNYNVNLVQMLFPHPKTQANVWKPANASPKIRNLKKEQLKFWNLFAT